MFSKSKVLISTLILFSFFFATSKNLKQSLHATKVFVPVMISRSHLFKVPICVGTPKQCFNALIDTGSSDLLVNSDLCTEVDCLGKKRFETKKSSTLHLLNQDMIVNI